MRTYVINSENRHYCQAKLSAMFKLRKELFVDRLGWANMVVTNGEERDEADNDPDVTYLVSVDESDQVVGSCRLVPTTGNCLLGGPLSNYLESPMSRLPTTWELTRFAPTSDPSDPKHGISFAYLAGGILEWSHSQGIDKILGIAEPPLMAIVGGLGLPVVIEGPPVEYEAKKFAFAFSFPVSEAIVVSTKAALRVAGTIVCYPTENDAEAA